MGINLASKDYNEKTEECIKLKRGFVISFILILTIMSNIILTNADDNDKLKELSNEFKLKNVTTIPKGIQPIEFTNIGELENFLNNVSQSKSSDNSDYVKLELNKSDKGMKVAATDPYTKEITVKKGETWVVGSFYVAADVEILVTPNKKIVTSCSDAYMIMEGFSLGLDYTEAFPPKSTYTNTSVTLKAKGTVDYYLLIEGVLKVYQRPYNFNQTFIVGDM